MLLRVSLLLLAALPTLAGVSVVGVQAAGPRFAPAQRTGVVARRGGAAELACDVRALGPHTVSWVRARDLQILSHAGAAFTHDARVSIPPADCANCTGALSRHALRIAPLRLSDAGRYECQLNTEPKMSLFFNLTVVDEPEPQLVVSPAGAATVEGREGGAATLACSARYTPAPRAPPPAPLDVRWLRHGKPLDLQGGGVSLDTERWAARALSRLTLGALSGAAAGPYECSVAGHSATLTLTVLPAGELSAEAMQQDEARGRAPPPAPPHTRAPLALALALLAARAR